MHLLSSRRARWAAPLAVAAGALVAATGLPGTSASADAHPDLPARTAGDLLASLSGVHVDGLSGTVVQTSRLGLPELPGAGDDASLSLTSLASGSRTLRVFAAGDDRQRLALLGQLSESDVVRSGRDVWTYTSSTRAVTHLVLPEDGPDGAGEQPVPAAGALTPQQAAEQALQAVDPTTEVTVDRTARVADRPAYQLVLTPRDARTLVGRVQVALDSETSLPLRVQVFPRGSATPAVEVGFTELSLRVPDDSVFAFTPPPGSPVTERALPAPPARKADAPPAARPDGPRGDVLGQGWTSVVRLPGAATDLSPAAVPLLDRLSTRVPGGRLVTSALVSVLIGDDGTVWAGAVRGPDLQQVAATGAGL